MKKVIIAIIVFIVAMAFTMPLFADPAELNQGQIVKMKAHDDRGPGVAWWVENQRIYFPDMTRGEWIHDVFRPAWHL